MPNPAVISPAMMITRKSERWMPPVPTGTPTPPKLKLCLGTTLAGQSSMPNLGFEHFWPANCPEANHPVV